MKLTGQIQYQIARLLTTKQLAQRLQVTQMSISNWRRYRGLPHIAVPGDRWPTYRYVQQDVDRWAKQRGINLDKLNGRNGGR
jgi:hypothetical protein